MLGNVTATVNPGAAPHVVVAAHADQIGLQVTWVDEQGFVYFDKLGSVDPLLLPGRAVVIQGRGGAVDGVVGKRPTHLIPEAERGKAADICDQWIDIGAPDRAAALARVACGDPIIFSPHFVELAGGFVAGRGARRSLRRLHRRARPRALRRRAGHAPRSRRSRPCRRRRATWGRTSRRAASSPTA